MSTLTVDSTEVPRTTTGGNFQGPTITVNDTTLTNCVVTSMRVSTSATSANLTQLGSGWVLRLDRPGAGPIGFDLIRNGPTLSGTQLGTSCGLTFADTGGSFSTAASPYNGTFRPAGSSSGTGFADYLGKSPLGQYGLYPAFLQGGSLTFDCFRIEFGLTTPTPTPRPTP